MKYPIFCSYMKHLIFFSKCSIIIEIEWIKFGKISCQEKCKLETASGAGYKRRHLNSVIVWPPWWYPIKKNYSLTITLCLRVIKGANQCRAWRDVIYDRPPWRKSINHIELKQKTGNTKCKNITDFRNWAN